VQFYVVQVVALCQVVVISHLKRPPSPSRQRLLQPIPLHREPRLPFLVLGIAKATHPGDNGSG
jgi:hypothetical protein